MKKIKREPEYHYQSEDEASNLLDELLPIAPDQECVHCHQKFPSTHALKLHIKNIHPSEDFSEQPMRCPFKGCQSSFRKVSSLDEHKKLHQQEKTIICLMCGKYCTSKDQLRSHMKYHQQPKHKCSECDLAFYDSKQLKNHHTSKHENARNFKCPMCDKTYFKSSHLSRHYKVTHQKQTINCIVPHCDRVYTRRERVITHISKQHPELSADIVESYVETIKRTPYTYAVNNLNFELPQEENSMSSVSILE
jgi:uncharacterized Zn-finger protein